MTCYNHDGDDSYSVNLRPKLQIHESSTNLGIGRQVQLIKRGHPGQVLGQAGRNRLCRAPLPPHDNMLLSRCVTRVCGPIPSHPHALTMETAGAVNVQLVLCTEISCIMESAAANSLSAYLLHINCTHNGYFTLSMNDLM